jgi:alpha-glucosidase
MLKIIRQNDQLNILFKDEIIIHHTSQEPSFYVGQGLESIDSYRGNFEIDDYIKTRIPLSNVDVEDQTLVFSHQEIKLTLKLSVEDDRLIGQFNLNQPMNRFWFRLFAENNESVYGCGEQSSYFNLKGRDFPLFTSESGVGRDPHSLTTFYANLKDKAGGYYYSTYYPETSFISSRKYWFHLNTYAYSIFNFKHPHFHELFTWEIPQGFVLSKKEHYTELLSDLTEVTGRPPLLPDYLLDGMILGVQGGLDQVLKYLKQAKDKGVQVSGLW